MKSVLFGYMVMIAMVVACMSPQPDGEVLSFDANACVDWDNMKKGYDADFSIINVGGVNLDQKTNGYLETDESRMAKLAVLTISSVDQSTYKEKKYDSKSARANKRKGTIEKESPRIKVEDVFIKQIGSQKKTWSLEGLVNVNDSTSSKAALANLDLANKLHLKSILRNMIKESHEYVGDDDNTGTSMQGAQGEEYKKVEEKGAQDKEHNIDKNLTAEITEALKKGRDAAHYAGTSTDEDGKTEVHIFMARGVPTTSEYSASGKYVSEADEDAQYDYDSKEYSQATDKSYGGEEDVEHEKEYEEEEYTSYRDQTVSPAVMSLFYKGMAFVSKFPAAEEKITRLGEIETLMPGIVNKIVGKYFFSTPCDGGGKNAKGVGRSKTVGSND